MERFPIILPALAVAAALLSPSQAKSDPETISQFAEAWNEYVTFCGSIIETPEVNFREIHSLASGRISTWAVTSDGSIAHGSIFLEEYLREISFHLSKSETGYSVFCETHAFTETDFDVAAIAVQLKELLAEHAGLTLTGGEVSGLPGASLSLEDAEMTPWFSYSTFDVFPEAELSTQVDVQTGGLSITVYGTLPR